ncbi:MAG: UMP kinase [Thermoplasmatales archaeon]|nr:UMP kinase [Thermoplasmatales archaeon]
MKVVVSLGGSLLSLDNPEFIEKLSLLLKKISDEISLFIVVGGGKTARNYISTGRKFCEDERYLDEIGIAATRLNAYLINSFFRKKIPLTIEEALQIGPPVVMGGTFPGHSTDAVAAMLAKEARADHLVIATDVDGIYDKDPKIYRDAIKFDKIRIDKLIEMVGGEWKMAGYKVVVDPVACKIIRDGRIKTFVVNGKNLKELENAIYGKEFNGTVIEV